MTAVRQHIATRER